MVRANYRAGTQPAKPNISRFQDCPFTPSQGVPGVMHGIGHNLLFVGFERHTKLNRLRISLLKLRRFLRYRPIAPATQMFHNANFHRVLFMVAQLDLKGFVNPRFGVHYCPRSGLWGSGKWTAIRTESRSGSGGSVNLKARLFAFAHKIEGIGS